jgi:hypothetical protein
MKMLFVLAFAALLVASPAFPKQKLFQDGVGISASCVVMPVGWVLLVERDPFLGAVKFFHNEERTDGIHSKYECFELSKKKGGAKKIGEGEVVFKQTSNKGSIKDLFFHEGMSSIFGPPLEIGKFSLCSYAVGSSHAAVYFWSKPHKADQKVRMAPTPWKEIVEVNLSDPRIRWFAYDEERERRIIPIDKIWD